MKILAIETSCDETSSAIVEDGKIILSNIISSSLALHSKTGGIIPEVAAREQVKYIIPVINKVLHQSQVQFKENISAIAVTIGPGLNGSLLIGVETAKTISYACKIPLIPVNHVLAHIYANWLNTDKLPQFPSIALVVSGGHTELFLITSHNKIKWLGGTLDDAAGEAFDKTARLLKLGYPGGPAIAAAAAQYQKSIRQLSDKYKKEIKLPRPMIGSNKLEFSFSGFKTAVLREVNKLKETKQFNNLVIQQLSFEIQEAITDVLVKKTLMAAKLHQVKSILLGGGVSANQRLTEKFKLEICNLKSKISLHIPNPSLCTDNAAYIASYAFFHFHPKSWNTIQTEPNLSVEV